MSKTALVTGASGFIALHVVNQLLQDGWNVHATVRSLKNQAKIKPITDLGANASGRLELFEADLQKPGSFADAMKGCDVVFHVASPFLVPEQVKNPLKQLIEPAIEGTHNVLATVNQTPSVQRVVLTSSGMF
jgi:dihydroflavonol-4-reductase